MQLISQSRMQLLDTEVINKMLLCPKHFSSWNPWNGEKTVYAICNLCGFGYCENHLEQVDAMFFA